MGETRSALGVICSSYDEFFEAEKKIADFMMEHKAEVVDMTVGELARASGTSDATVSRFCRRCGFKGFHSLKLALAREVLEEEQMDRNVSNDIDRGDLRQSLQNILANKVAELTETVNMMDPANLEHILDRLEHARAGSRGQYHSRGSGRRLQIQPAGNTGCGRGYMGNPDCLYL